MQKLHKTTHTKIKLHLMNIYELISVCMYLGHSLTISKTTYSSHTKLIGQSLHVSEHGIGYSNLAFSDNKGQKRPLFSFESLKPLEGQKNSELEH